MINESGICVDGEREVRDVVYAAMRVTCRLILKFNTLRLSSLEKYPLDRRFQKVTVRVIRGIFLKLSGRCLYYATLLHNI